MDKIKIFIKSIYAGFMIGVGGIVYLSLDNKAIGSLLFSYSPPGLYCLSRLLITLEERDFCSAISAKHCGKIR